MTMEEQLKIIDAQKEISKLNKKIAISQEKINNLNFYIEKKEVLLYKKVNQEKYYGRDGIWHDDKNVEIYLYYDGVKVDCESFLCSLIDKYSIFTIFEGQNPWFIKENDPMWNLLTVEFIKSLEEKIQESQEAIEKIKEKFERR